MKEGTTPGFAAFHTDGLVLFSGGELLQENMREDLGFQGQPWGWGRMRTKTKGATKDVSGGRQRDKKKMTYRMPSENRGEGKHWKATNSHSIQ